MAGLIESEDLLAFEDLLPSQYSNAARLRKYLSIFLSEVQALEDANTEFSNVSTSISVAEGYQLDIIGKLVGAERRGKSDAEYREEIYFRISINIGNGTSEDCLQYLSYVTQATNTRIWNHYPASVIMETNGTNIPLNIPNTLDNITMAGVSVGGVISVPPSREVFIMCEETEAYSNYTDISAPYPELELGGDDMECGNLEAELSYITFRGFKPLLDGDILSRSTLPDEDYLKNKYFGFLGNILAGSFGSVYNESIGAPLLSLYEYAEQTSTKGIFADVYTKI